MQKKHSLNFLSLIFLLLFTTTLFAKNVSWQEMRDFPPGAKIAIISGNLGKKAPFVVQIKFPAHYIVPAHSHPFEAHATVVSGVYYIGTGLVADGNVGQALNAGNSFIIPANNKHYGCTKQDGVVLQLEAMGPWDIMYSANG